MGNVYVLGIEMTRFGKHIETSIRSMTRHAVEAAGD